MLRAMAAIREMRNGGSSRAGVIRREKRYQHKDGSDVAVQITASTTGDGQPDRRSFFVALVENMGERQRAEIALAESEQRTQAVMEAALDAIVTLDGDGRVTAANTAAEMFGRTSHDLCSRTAAQLIRLDDQYCWQAADALVGQRIEGTALPVGAEPILIELAIAGYELAGRREFTVFVRDIALRRAAEEHLTRQALHDGLTGLPNRTLLHQRLREAMVEAGRTGTLAALLLLDLDGFKRVNDTFGHHVGDQLLQAVARLLSGVVRSSDTVARLGGDEFAIVLPETHEPGSVAAVAAPLS
jgi:PAS domain S-box-containing protein